MIYIISSCNKEQGVGRGGGKKLLGGGSSKRRLKNSEMAISKDLESSIFKKFFSRHYKHGGASWNSPPQIHERSSTP